jgi:hypothetical protein
MNVTENGLDKRGRVGIPKFQFDTLTDNGFVSCERHKNNFVLQILEDRDDYAFQLDKLRLKQEINKFGLGDLFDVHRSEKVEGY